MFAHVRVMWVPRVPRTRCCVALSARGARTRSSMRVEDAGHRDEDVAEATARADAGAAAARGGGGCGGGGK